MRTKYLTLLAPAMLMLIGCDERARTLAQQTKTILDQRSVQLSKKIAAETKAYNASAVKSVKDGRNLVSNGLSNERSERADRLTVDYVEQKQRVSLWRQHLSDYAQADYSRNRDLLLTDLDASTLYLQRYESLRIEQDKVDALSKLLDVLATKQPLKDQVDAVAGFAKDTKTEFDKKVCTGLKGNSDAAAKQLYADKKCDDVLK